MLYMNELDYMIVVDEELARVLEVEINENEEAKLQKLCCDF